MLEPVKYVMLRDMARVRPNPFKRPADPIKLAKLVGDIATGQQIEPLPPPSAEDIRRVMSALGKIGGPKGGKARAKALTSEERAKIARKAARTRWKRSQKPA